jgi:hypothetical protein
MEESIPRLGTEENRMKKISEKKKSCSSTQKRQHVLFSVPRNAGIPPEQTNCFVFSVFRGVIFLSVIANPPCTFSLISLIFLKYPVPLNLKKCGLRTFKERTWIKGRPRQKAKYHLCIFLNSGWKLQGRPDTSFSKSGQVLSWISFQWAPEYPIRTF